MNSLIVRTSFGFHPTFLRVTNKWAFFEERKNARQLFDRTYALDIPVGKSFLCTVETVYSIEKTSDSLTNGTLSLVNKSLGKQLMRRVSLACKSGFICIVCILVDFQRKKKGSVELKAKPAATQFKRREKEKIDRVVISITVSRCTLKKPFHLHRC